LVAEYLCVVACCLPVVPTWCFVYTSLRPKRSRITAWAAASVLAILWLPFLVQYRWWLRRHPRTWVDDVERYLQGIRS
jgi:hypothetical protein